MVDFVFLSFDFVQLPEAFDLDFFGHFGQIIADEVHDGIVFIDFFGVGGQCILGVGQTSVDGTLHGVGIDMVVFDFYKTLGRIDHKIPLVMEFIGGFCPVENVFQQNPSGVNLGYSNQPRARSRTTAKCKFRVHKNKDKEEDI